MRHGALSRMLATGSILAGLAGPAMAAEDRVPLAAPRPAAGPGTPTEPPRRPSTTDELFARLAAARDAEEAAGIAVLIGRRLERSGSDTADLLASRAGLALKAEDGALAVELLDRAIQLRPGWAEGWNRRAAAFFQLEDPVRAMTDVKEALALEPRHFEAWAALGHLEMANGDKALALAAYRRALAIHPFFEDLRKVVDRLAPEVEGRDL